MSRPLRLLIVAGEVSGDMHAARLVEAIQRQNPAVECFGIGGDALRATGMEILYDARDMAVMGFTEVVRRLGFFRKAFGDLLAAARKRRPDAVILVDYPGFNLRFAARAHALGLRVIYYICPQVWAWNRRRIPHMARIVDRLIAIFPFEPQVFAGTSLKVDFVGHPLVDEIAAALREPEASLPWQGTPRIALLPGSRRQEIEHILPALLDAAALIQRHQPNASFIIPAPSTEIGNTVRQMLAGLPPGPARLSVVDGLTRQVLRQATAAWVASGTATIEAALLNCPMAVVYKTSPLTYLLARLLVSVPFIGMVNVVAGRQVCPEFIQGTATPEALAGALQPLIESEPVRRQMLEGFRQVQTALGPGGAAERAAAIVLAQVAAGVPGHAE